MAQKKFDLNDILSVQSVTTAILQGPVFDISMIPLSEIKPSEDNFYDTSDIEGLAADILMNGLMHNIVIGPKDASGMHTIISGERRYRAFTSLRDEGYEGYEYIPAKIDIEGNEAIQQLKLINANATTRVLSDSEKVEQAARITEIIKQLKAQGYEIPGRSREITARVLGLSVSQVGRMEKIDADLVPEVKKQLARGDIGITRAYEISTLPKEQQESAAAKKKVDGRTAPAKKDRKKTIEYETSEDRITHLKWAREEMKEFLEIWDMMRDLAPDYNLSRAAIKYSIEALEESIKAEESKNEGA